MPGGFPLGLEVCNGNSYGVVAASSVGTTITGSASSNTKGSWTQIVASTAYDACAIAVIFNQNASATGGEMFIDIGVGGSGSEQVIISDILSPYGAASLTNACYVFPVSIPAGSRVSARLQSTATSDANYVLIELFDGAFTQMEGVAGVDAIGFVAATTILTSIDPGSSANTKGAYTQLIASTSRDYVGLIIVFDSLGAAPASASNGLLDISIGGAGSEQIIIPDIMYRRSAALVATYPTHTGIYHIPIPSGTRIAARCQSNNTTSGDRFVGCGIYGLYQ